MAAKKLPIDLLELKDVFLSEIKNILTEFQIPSDLVINWDQTNSKYVPAKEWSMDTKGAKQVPIFGLEDKREMTVLLAVTSSGDLLPTELIYAGKTDRCHPKYVFPEGHHITHTESHWSNEESMLGYVDKIIVPYVNAKRKSIGNPTQHALCIFYFFEAHKCESVRNKLIENKIDYVNVPACCIHELRPLDLTCNQCFKTLMKERFAQWYVEQVAGRLHEGVNMCDVKVDINMSKIKPLHAAWVTKSLQELSKDETLIKKGFDQSGITGAIDIGLN